MATLGKYELVREVGQGGMSTVYEAIDPAIGRRVALKVLTIPPYLSQVQREVLVARLQREARAAGRLNHPNIVTIYDVSEDGGHHFIAMEFLEGATLQERLTGGPLSPDEAAHILEPLADALDAAHAQGVLHRDIKPGNVMLLPGGRVKLTDFSVARAIDDATVTHAGATIGSPAYLSPEQVRGEPATAASDRWALGILLYEMLAGRPPFRGEHIAAVLHQVAYDDPAPLSGASPRLQAVLQRALEKDPARRYGSAGELPAALRAATRPAPIPHPVTPAAREHVVAERASAARLPARRLRHLPWAWAVPALLLLAAVPFVAGRLVSVRALWSAASGQPAVVVQPEAASSRAAPAPAVEPSRAPRPGIKVVERTTTRSTSSVRSSPVPSRPTQRVAGARVASVRRTARHRASQSPPRAEPARRRMASGPAAEPGTRTARQVKQASSRPPGTSTRRARESSRQRSPASRTPVRVARRTSEVTRVKTVKSGQGRTRLAGSAVALNNRAYRMQRGGRHREAEPLLREALRKNPNYAYAQYNLGWSLVEQGRAREALTPLQRTAARQPRRWEPQQRLGQAYEQLGDVEKARAAYARARALRSRG